MDKKVDLFKYETFAVRKAKCTEALDFSRKRDR
jgi:hypothetical protein